MHGLLKKSSIAKHQLSTNPSGFIFLTYFFTSFTLSKYILSIFIQASLTWPTNQLKLNNLGGMSVVLHISGPTFAEKTRVFQKTRVFSQKTRVFNPGFLENPGFLIETHVF